MPVGLREAVTRHSQLGRRNLIGAIDQGDSKVRCCAAHHWRYRYRRPGCDPGSHRDIAVGAGDAACVPGARHRAERSRSMAQTVIDACVAARRRRYLRHIDLKRRRRRAVLVVGVRADEGDRLRVAAKICLIPRSDSRCACDRCNSVNTYRCERAAVRIAVIWHLRARQRKRRRGCRHRYRHLVRSRVIDRRIRRREGHAQVLRSEPKHRTHR